MKTDNYKWQAQWWTCYMLQPDWTFALHEITVHLKNTPFKTAYSRKHKLFGIKSVSFMILRDICRIWLCNLVITGSVWFFQCRLPVRLWILKRQWNLNVMLKIRVKGDLTATVLKDNVQTCWWTCIVYQHRVVLWWAWKLSEVIHSPRLKGTWVIWTGLTAQWTVVPLAIRPGNGRWSCSSTFWTFVLQKYHSNSSELHWSGTWHMRQEGCLSQTTWWGT